MSEITSHDTRGVSPLVYELFVLGELMEQPMYGYLLREIAERVLGPLQPLSWGVIYPLIRKLEKDGLTTSTTEKPRSGFPRKERGQQRRMYAITPAGKDRFFQLMLTPTEYNRDTTKLFIIKLTKFWFLTPEQRLTVLEWYREYLQELHEYYLTASQDVLRNPEINEHQRPWILQFLDYQIQRFKAELAWIDNQIIKCKQE